MKRLTGGQGATGPAGSVSAAGSGTAAAPGIAFASDTNTGIYNPAADNLAFSTGGTGRLFIDASGNVGVGTASPSFDLTVEKNVDSFVTTYIRSTNTGSSAGGRLIVASAVGGLSLAAHSAAHSTWPNTATITSDSAFTGGLVINAAGTNPLQFYTNNNERARITSAGLVGIGTSSPAVALDVNGNGSFKSSILFTDSQTKIGDSGIIDGGAADGNTQINFFSGKSLILKSGGSERARIDSSGRLLVGTSTARNSGTTGSAPLFQIDSATNPSAAIVRTTADAFASAFILGKIRSTSIVSSGDEIGVIAFEGYDGSAQKAAANIIAAVDGTPGANDMPGRLVFSTTADGAASPTERMRIDSTGLMTLAGPGIKFPATQVASSDPNTLDDYEEGTFTPTVTQGVTSVTYDATTTRGIYRKIGSQLFFTLRINLTAGTTNGSQLVLGALPFAPSLGNTYKCVSVGRFMAGASGTDIHAELTGDETSMLIFDCSDRTTVTGTEATNTLDLIVTGSYPTA